MCTEPGQYCSHVTFYVYILMKIVGKLTGTRTGRHWLGKGGLSPLYTFRLIRIKCKWAWQQRTLTWIRIERFPGRWQMCPSCSKYPHLSTLPLVTRPGGSGPCVSLSSLVAAGLWCDKRSVWDTWPVLVLTLLGPISGHTRLSCYPVSPPPAPVTMRHMGLCVVWSPSALSSAFLLKLWTISLCISPDMDM